MTQSVIIFPADFTGRTLEPKVQPTLSVRFGLFDVDLVRGIVTRQGTRLKLQDQPFRILTILLQRPGEIVTREELRQALWQDGTHVNFDGSLNAALKKLRSCLQDDAENPRFIETVPRQGYRFLAPVHQIHPRVNITSANPPVTATGTDEVEIHLSMQPEFSAERAAELQKERRKEQSARRWWDNDRYLVWFLAVLLHHLSDSAPQRATNGAHYQCWRHRRDRRHRFRRQPNFFP